MELKKLRKLIYGTVEEGYLVTNTRGDVVAIVDNAGNVVAKYTYDAWGKLMSVIDASGNDIENVSGLAGLSDAELDKLYKNPNISKKEKQRIKKEQKARDLRNKQKRKNKKKGK